MLFFDLDGTLLDSNGVWLDIDVEFLGQQGPTPADGPRRNSRSTELQNLSLRSAFGQGAALL